MTQRLSLLLSKTIAGPNFNTQLTTASYSSTMSVLEKVKKRVAERDSWTTYKVPTIGMLCKLFYSSSDMVFQTHIPSQEEIDKVFPIASVDWNALRNPPKDKIQSTWIGHATTFVQMGGYNIITDPIFSKRCSAVQFAGPERYRRPACTIQDLCGEDGVGIDIVLVSHNHYDHLDYNSVRTLAALAIETNRPMQFVVALGLKRWFERYVPDSTKGSNKVTEIDWHETYSIEGKGDDNSGKDDAAAINITGIPMQHWSNRHGFDKDKTLWCGFKVTTTGSTPKNYLFSGDTGFFDGLYEIGKRYGPFDLAAIPIGAYEPRWFMKEQHTNPGDAVKMMGAIQANRAFPIHWGTFALTVEPIMEPREGLGEAMDEVGKDRDTFAPSLIGETIIV